MDPNKTNNENDNEDLQAQPGAQFQPDNNPSQPTSPAEPETTVGPSDQATETPVAYQPTDTESSTPVEPTTVTPETPPATEPTTPAAPDAPAGIASAAPAAPAAPAAQSSDATVVSSGDLTGASAAVGSQSKFAKHKKALIISAVSLLVLLGGAAAFYFGYWTNSSVVYSQGLSNAGKGLEALTTYLDEESGKDYKAYTGSGKYLITAQGTEVKGDIGLKATDKDAELTLGVDWEQQNVDVALRAFNVDSSKPEVYFKADNIEGLGALTGSAELGAAIDQLSGKWIGVDQELIEQLEQSTADDPAAQPTEQQILSAVEAFNKVNREYVFTADESKAVMKVVKVYGKETVDGHSTYRYQMAYVKENIKKYVTAQQEALKSSELNKWIEENDYQGAVNEYFEMLATSADEVDEEYRFDLWSDINERVLYKLRFPDTEKPNENYVDIGLDYTGGDVYPFFVTAVGNKGAEDESNISFRFTINGDDNSYEAAFNTEYKGLNSFKVTADFTAKPTNEALEIDKPADAIPLSQVLEQLGLGGLLTPPSTEPAFAPATEQSQFDTL